jgi:hypothetical protein
VPARACPPSVLVPEVDVPWVAEVCDVVPLPVARLQMLTLKLPLATDLTYTMGLPLEPLYAAMDTSTTDVATTLELLTWNVLQVPAAVVVLWVVI